ncbi:MAG: PAS domain-containing protein, partial [Caldilineaceae bacterium]
MLSELPTPDLDDDALSALSPDEIRRILQELHTCKATLSDREESLRQAQSTLRAALARYETFYTDDYRQISDALRTSEDLLRYIIEHNPTNISVYDREMRYVYVGQRHLGDDESPRGNVIGKCHYDLFPDVPQKWRNAHQRALAGEVMRVDEDSYTRADGQEEWVRWECRPWYEMDGEIGGIVLYTEDITQRKHTEAALRESEGKYRRLVQNLSAGITVHAPDTRILLVNDRACELFGLTAEQIIGTQVDSPQWRLERRDRSPMPLDEYPVSMVLKTRKPVENIICGTVHPQTREIVWVMTNAYPEFDANGEVQQIVVTAVNVTPQIEAEDLATTLNQQLVHQERLAAVGELSAGIAHDFNNILAVIALHVPLVRQSTVVDSSHHRHLDVIQTQIGRAARLIQQILDFGRQAVLEKRPLDLVPFLQEQVELLSRTLPENVVVSLGVESGQHVALVDLTRMQQ